MRSGTQIGIQKLAALISVIFLQAGCTYDYFEPLMFETHLRVTVENGGFTGVSHIPESGATVFLFEPDFGHSQRINVSAGQIAAQEAISIVYRYSSPPLASVWAGTEGYTLPGYASSEGLDPDEVLITIPEGRNGYRIPGGELLFGMTKFSRLPEEDVLLTPKVGQVNITVKGLPTGASADEYYFTVLTGYNGYDFTGMPQRGDMELKLDARFNTKNDLVTKQPYNMIHYPEQAQTGLHADQGAEIRLFRKAATDPSPTLVALFRGDTNGNPIIFERGKTTNILLDMGLSGEMDISIIITGWGEIHQWNEW